jgi:hypothetical protein
MLIHVLFEFNKFSSIWITFLRWWSSCLSVNTFGEGLSRKGEGGMVFNASFNNISAISWWSVLLVEETRVPRENHWPAASHWQTLSHCILSSTPCHERGFELITLVIGTGCTGSCKSNYHTIMTTTVPYDSGHLVFLFNTINIHSYPIEEWNITVNTY